jgi:NADPH-dependent 2,4-dienoyl-CoA reductase/sulfur reductase-like enzyme
MVVETADDCLTLSYDRLILATGARERFLPFPGWTLPNVMGAGGLQALAKSGLPIAGKSVIVAGSGPLLLAVAAYLGHYAKIPLVAEQAPREKVIAFGMRLAGSPGKLMQAVGLRWSLRGVPYRLGCWPVAARGDDRVEIVTLTDGERSWDEPCDYLACGFGLVPNIELARLLGCAVQQGFVVVDERQQTGVEGIFCAGEPTGIGGLDKALVEGEIAGLCATGQYSAAHGLFRRRDHARAFARALEDAFAIRDELRRLPHEQTIVCRCEDVTLGQLTPYTSMRAAKLHTRCGMGPCQGRICGAAIEFLRGWPPDTVRPPVRPARLESLLSGSQ